MATSGTCLLVRTWLGAGVSWDLLGEARDAADHPATHRTASPPRMIGSQMSRVLRLGNPASVLLDSGYVNDENQTSALLARHRCVLFG